MHAEDLTLQLLCKTLLSNLALRAELPNTDLDFGGHDIEYMRNSLKQSPLFAQSHVDCIRQFGRFPGRNKALGRTTTEQEQKYLEEHPAGF